MGFPPSIAVSPATHYFHQLLHSHHHLSYTAGTIGEYVIFEVFTAETMQNGVFWDVTPCGSYKSHMA
jgi:hypothetical protein